MLNMPGVEGLKVGVADVPKLIAGTVDGAVKLNPDVAANKMEGAFAINKSVGIIEKKIK